MRIENISGAFHLYSRSLFRLVIGVSLAIIWNVPFADGQNTPGTGSQGVMLTSDLLFKSPAKLLYVGDNLVPTGKLNVKTYRLEEVKLPQPVELVVRGKRKSIESIIRLTIIGERLQPGTYTVWIGEDSLSDVMRSPIELVTVIYDRSLLESGAPIAVSYETNGDGSRTVLPEALYVPAEVKRGSQDINSETTVTRITKVHSQGNNAVIEIELTSDEGFQGRNAQQIFQIGKFETYGSNPPDGDGYKWIIRMPVEVFDRLEDDTPIILKTERGERGLRGARTITRLNKHLLEK
jgi:hypothetical protein